MIGVKREPCAPTGQRSLIELIIGREDALRMDFLIVRDLELVGPRVRSPVEIIVRERSGQGFPASDERPKGLDEPAQSHQTRFISASACEAGTVRQGSSA